MRLRWARSISTFFRLSRETLYPFVVRQAPATWRGVLVLLAGHRTELHVRAAPVPRRAGLAVGLEGAVFAGAGQVSAAGGIGVVPAELLQLMALGADVSVVLRVPFEGGSGRHALDRRSATSLSERACSRCGDWRPRAPRQGGGSIGRDRHVLYCWRQRAGHSRTAYVPAWLRCKPRVRWWSSCCTTTCASASSL